MSDTCVKLPDPRQRKPLWASKIIRMAINHLLLGTELRILYMLGKGFTTATSSAQGLYFWQRVLCILDIQSARLYKLVVNTIKKMEQKGGVWFSTACLKAWAPFLTLEKGHSRNTQNLGLTRQKWHEEVRCSGDWHLKKEKLSAICRLKIFNLL